MRVTTCHHRYDVTSLQSQAIIYVVYSNSLKEPYVRNPVNTQALCIHSLSMLPLGMVMLHCLAAWSDQNLSGMNSTCFLTSISSINQFFTDLNTGQEGERQREAKGGKDIQQRDLQKKEILPCCWLPRGCPGEIGVAHPKAAPLHHKSTEGGHVQACASCGGPTQAPTRGHPHTGKSVEGDAHSSAKKGGLASPTTSPNGGNEDFC